MGQAVIGEGHGDADASRPEEQGVNEIGERFCAKNGARLKSNVRPHRAVDAAQTETFGGTMTTPRGHFRPQRTDKGKLSTSR
jgi:hypothetical protein